MTTELLRSPIHNLHLELGARMVPFAGWELPVQYPAGPIQEHLSVRHAAGLFDISHMGRLRLEGPGAESLLQRVMTRNMSKIRQGTAVYGLITYADGTVVDDVIVVHRGTYWLLVTNGVNRVKVLSWLRAHTADGETTIADESLETAMLALQGPKACEALSKLLDTDLGVVGRFRCWDGFYSGQSILLTRTGYTGEDGFEILCNSIVGPQLFRSLLGIRDVLGVQACGLAARDSLRLECGFPLYGHEISSKISPLEAGLGWAISFRKKNFIGREALLKQNLEGTPRRLIGFQMVEGGMPRASCDVYRGDLRVGEVTSGNKSPTLNKFIGLALCSSDLDPQCAITIEIRGKRRQAEIVPVPFVSPHY